MKIIVGLGNPGRRYEATPHNLGFEAVDELARRWALDWRLRERDRMFLAEGRAGGEAVALIKPVTFMNLSGEAVAPFVRQKELGDEGLLVVTDDVNLPIGRIRLRPSGSHGGHNGLRSMIERLGHSEFGRLRIGIQPTWPVDDLVAFVLQRLPPRERDQLAEMVPVAADAAEMWIEQGCKPTADRFNGERRFPEED